VVINGLTCAVREPGPPVEINTTHAYYQLFYRMLMLRLCRFCDIVFGVSPMHAAELASKSGVLSVHLWPPSVDEENFDPRRHVKSRELTRDKLLVSDKFVLIYHGVVSNERGLDELLQAIGLIRKQAPDVVLLILGTGYSAERLRSVAIANGLAGNVIFHGRVPYEEVPLFLAAADAGVIPLPVLPQWSTQTPIKLLEYLAMEKPVILTETESHKWIIGEEGHAFFCGKGTPEQLVKAILECRARHVRPMRDDIVTRFSSKAIAGRVLTLLSQERGK
ncbi:MAG: glycosyltransferase, partial [Candidatus Bathyarchaeia archaeon]